LFLENKNHVCMMVVSTCVVCEVLGSWSAGPCMVL